MRQIVQQEHFEDPKQMIFKVKKKTDNIQSIIAHIEAQNLLISENERALKNLVEVKKKILIVDDE